jgi:hypothetical protein
LEDLAKRNKIRSTALVIFEHVFPNVEVSSYPVTLLDSALEIIGKRSSGHRGMFFSPK